MDGLNEGEAVPYPFGEANRLTLETVYDDLRKVDWLTKVEMPHGGRAWLAVRYDHCRLVLGDNRFSRARSAQADSPRLSPELPPPTAIVALDPPEHTRVRRLVALAFTASRVEQMRPDVERLVAELIDEMEQVGPPVDLLSTFAIPLPLQVICSMLGVAFEDRVYFRRFSEALVTRNVPLEEVSEARNDLEDYLTRIITDRRADPKDDLLSDLAAVSDEGDQRSSRCATTRRSHRSRGRPHPPVRRRPACHRQGC